MKKPALQDDAFIADVENTWPDLTNLHVWWLGQSGFLVLWHGEFLVLDPYLSDSLTLKYAQTDKPHIRMTERVVAPERLGFVSVATSSHNHTDHLDRDTLLPMLQANPKLEIVVPEANRLVAAERLGLSPTRLRPLNAGQSLETGVFTLHGVPAAHNELDLDAEGHHRCLGYLVQAGPWTIYHAGDTVRFNGLEDWLRCWPIDIALLPINGNRPERGVAGNLNGREAATLAKTVGARIVIPCHYDLFEFNTASPDEFVATCRRLGQPHRVLPCGGRLSSAALQRGPGKS